MSTGTVALPPHATTVPGPPRAWSRPDAGCFPHPGYREAYARLLEGLRQARGLLVLTGEAGTGKTLLLRNLIQDPTVRLHGAWCGSTHLNVDTLLTHLCDQFQLIPRGRERPQQRAALQEYLTTCAEQGITVVVLIDEAHHLSPEVLPPLLTLAEPRLEEGHRLQLVLSGLPRLEALLRQPPDLPATVAKAVHVRLEPLRAAELTAFIHWQWQRTAGPATDNRLSVPVIDRMARQTLTPG
jgi:general secretion pathway protein A